MLKKMKKSLSTHTFQIPSAFWVFYLLLAARLGFAAKSNLCDMRKDYVVYRSVAIYLFNMLPPPPYLKLFFTSFTFRIIATQRTFIKKKFNYVICNVNRNTAVEIYVKIRKFLMWCSTMQTTYHIAQKAKSFRSITIIIKKTGFA